MKIMCCLQIDSYEILVYTLLAGKRALTSSEEGYQNETVKKEANNTYHRKKGDGLDPGT